MTEQTTQLSRTSTLTVASAGRGWCLFRSSDGKLYLSLYGRR